MRCLRCGQWGHGAGEKLCPLNDELSATDRVNKTLLDPMRVQAMVEAAARPSAHIGSYDGKGVKLALKNAPLPMGASTQMGLTRRQREEAIKRQQHSKQGKQQDQQVPHGKPMALKSGVRQFGGGDMAQFDMLPEEDDDGDDGDEDLLQGALGADRDVLQELLALEAEQDLVAAAGMHSASNLIPEPTPHHEYFWLNS